ncbi:T9SS type A sorting domain-containing protein [candidate division WOR-3 bacterium]|nr:T9SS type A sorting domain-containing protein [candidate division WOR-3 bacterium]
MKKYVIVITSLLPLAGFAAERMVVAELFTSTTCPPCVAGNSMLNSLATDKESFLGVVRYHMSWPSPGNDPFYNYHKPENNTRRQVYLINSVPTIVIDGIVKMGGADRALWGPAIDDRRSVESPLYMKVYRDFQTSAFSADQGSGTALVEITNESTEESYSIYLYGTLTESNVAYTGTNGDPIHNQVMIDIISSPWGDDLTFEPAETKLIIYDFSIDDTVPILDAANEPTGEVHIVSSENCELLFWGQDDETDEILQGTKVKIPNQKHLSLSDIELSDDGADGQLHPGEQARFHLTIHNGESKKINGVRVYVEVDNDQITVLKGVAEITEIAANSSYELKGDDLVIEASSGYDGSIFNLNCYSGSQDGSFTTGTQPLGLIEEAVTFLEVSIPAILKPGSRVKLGPYGDSFHRILIFDSSGRLVDVLYEGQGRNLSEIVLPEIPVGLYLICIQTDGVNQTSKIVLVK